MKYNIPERVIKDIFFLRLMREYIMKKIDNFSAGLNAPKIANFEETRDDIIYRTGIVGQFNLTEDIDTLVILICDNFIYAFDELLEILILKEREAGSDNWDD